MRLAASLLGARNIELYTAAPSTTIVKYSDKNVVAWWA